MRFYREVHPSEVRAEAVERRKNPFLQRLAKRFRNSAADDAKGYRFRPTALPERLLETAEIAGFDGARVWGDVFTPAFEELLVEKNRQIVAAAESGQSPKGRTDADFLAISGGGDKGAFAAGLLSGWSARGDRPQFEIVTGVSAGALAAPFAFVGRDTCLSEIYTEYGASQLFKSRGVRGFLSDALNDTTRLDQLIRTYVSDLFLDQIAHEHQKGRRLLVLTTNLDAQRQCIWSLSAIACGPDAQRRDLFVKILRASSALPGVFPPVKIDVIGRDGRAYDELHVDGGVTAEIVFTPPESQILHIEDRFFPQRRKRTLYVIQNGKLGPEYAPIEERLIPLARRAVQTLVKYQVVDNLVALALTANRNHSRFLFNSIPASFEAKSRGMFDKESAKELFKEGFEVGLSGRWFTSPPTSPTVRPSDIFDLSKLEVELVAEGRASTVKA